MLNCEEATRLMSDALERPLTRGERLSLQVHRMMCRGCRNFGPQLQGLREAARHYAQGRGEPKGDGSP